jgi:RNA-directed DNA polymerase
MTDALTSGSMSPGLLEVAERARQQPQAQLHSLAHLIDVEALRRAFGRQKPNAAVGVDGVTKEQYGQDLEKNLQDLHQRLRRKQWRHQPIRRVHIRKDGKGNKTRPIGISCFEDKIVQQALSEVLARWGAGRRDVFHAGPWHRTGVLFVSIAGQPLPASCPR